MAWLDISYDNGIFQIEWVLFGIERPDSASVLWNQQQVEL